MRKLRQTGTKHMREQKAHNTAVTKNIEPRSLQKYFFILMIIYNKCKGLFTPRILYRGLEL